MIVTNFGVLIVTANGCSTYPGGRSHGVCAGGEYRILLGLFRNDKASETAEQTVEELEMVKLSRNMHGLGQTLAELGLRELGVEVVALRRGGIRIPHPPQEVSLRLGDILLLTGRPAELAQVKYLLSHGPNGRGNCSGDIDGL